MRAIVGTSCGVTLRIEIPSSPVIAAITPPSLYTAFDTRRLSPYFSAMTKEQLAKRIAEVALLRGEFTLRSGRKSNYYLDKYRFETQGDVLEALGKMFSERVGAHVDRIAGAELG